MQQPGPWQQQQQPGWGAPAQPTPYVPQHPQVQPPSGEPDVSAIEAIKFLFKDPNWQNNLLIGSVYTLIPVVGSLSLMGWHCEIVQRIARKHPQPIPKLDFSDLGHYLGRGVAPFVVSLILTLPISIVATGIFFAAMFGGVALASAVGEPAVIIPIYVVAGLLTWVLGLGVGVLMVGGMTRAELTEDIGGSLSVGAMFSYAGKVFWKTMIANFVYGLLIWPLFIAGYLACFVGLYPAIVIMAVGSSYLRAQLYQLYLARGGEPIQLKAPVQVPSELARQAFAGAPAAQYGQHPGQVPQQPGGYQAPGQPPAGGPYPGGWQGR